jgi:hypothetical protein
MNNIKYKQTLKNADKFILPGLVLLATLLIYFFDFQYTFEIAIGFFLIWFTYFILKYFRVFQNHELQNVFINQYILKREYQPQPKTVRQKIKDLQKQREYNKTYNSNYNNFTKYSTNLPTNKDFTFDYLEIQESNNKNRLEVYKNPQ